MRIKAVEDDRQKRWEDYDKGKDKLSERLDKQCTKLNDVMIGLQAIDTNVKWLMKK